MSGYYKAWDIADCDSDFVALRLIDRGMLSELYRLCKSRGDTDRLVYRSYRQLAQDVASDERTVQHSLSRITQTDLASVENSTKAGKKLITIILTYYYETQQAKTIKELKELVEKRRGTTVSPCSSYQEDKIREEQIREEKEPPASPAVDNSTEPKLSVMTPIDIFEDAVKDHQKDIWALCCLPQYGEKYVRGEIVKMRAWIIANPDKAPRLGILAWINKWLVRGLDDKGKPKRASPERGYYGVDEDEGKAEEVARRSMPLRLADIIGSSGNGNTKE